MRFRPFRHHRPPWWPENEAWPPQRRPRHYPFFRGMGCLFAFFNMLGWAIVIFILVTVARNAGWLSFGGEHFPLGLPVVVGILIAALVTIVFVGSGLRRVFTPLDDLVEAAERVADGDYSVRVGERGPRAVGSLVRAFNNMASRLDSTQANRRNLLADVTHEMRTPLTVIQGNLEGMLDGVYPADEAKLRGVLDETVLLSRIIEDLRTLAVAESGTLQLKRQPTDLEALIHEAAGAFQAQAGSKGVNLTVDAAPNTSAINVDHGRILQVLTNLISNALRYTPAGGTVRVSCAPADSMVVVEVQDTGPGIAPEDLPHVFERFYRSADSGGMGLGLAIAKHLVEAHGGTLTAASGPGRGTTMRMALPAQPR